MFPSSWVRSVRTGLLLLCALGTVQLSAAQTPPAANRLERVLAAKKVRVCIWPDYYGVSLRSPRTQQLAGVDADLAQELGRDLGVAVEYVDSSFAKLVSDVTGDRCDLAMFAVGVTPQRAEKLMFTRPTLASDIYAITTRSNRRIKTWDDIDKPGVVVAVMKGTLHEPVMRARLKAATLLVLDTPMAREQEVESGRADVFMTDFPYSRRMLETTDWARLVAPTSSYHMTDYAYAVAPGDEKWLGRVEQFVRDIKRDGRLLRAASRYKLESIAVLN
ncbi:ABC transporter substrate-binding protein [Hydrogenophaga sp. OTU3427]|uniref:ABC transporter substrate-binding protein n=1 Tax=Hydrogenophaga sp. OTU3427 TaxID=3043856 RepID=UPI00313E70E4